MKNSRNLVFLGVVALLLLLGAAVSVRSRAATSPVAVDAPAAAALAASSMYQRSSQPYYVTASDPAALAASSLYQRSSQPYYVGAGVQGLSNLELRRAESQTSAPGIGSAMLTSVRREPGMASGR